MLSAAGCLSLSDLAALRSSCDATETAEAMAAHEKGIATLSRELEETKADLESHGVHLTSQLALALGRDQQSAAIAAARSELLSECGAQGLVPIREAEALREQLERHAEAVRRLAAAAESLARHWDKKV